MPRPAQLRVASTVAVLLAFPFAGLRPAIADDLPAGGVVTSGAAAIGATSGGLLIDQSSAKAIIDWSSFSIGAGTSVQFNNGSGATLNRVTGGSVSSLDGVLSATGSVYVLNPNGVIIGKNGVVQVGGSFIASTLGIDNDDFLNGGDTTFAGNSTATVVNLGKVGALGGDVALIATEVRNDGDIDAPNGTAALVAGRDILMRDAALEDGKFVVRVGGSDTSATNTGAINAAAAELRANGGNVLALAGNTKGVVRATGVSKSGGRVFLTAGGGSVRVSGKVRATKPGATGDDGGNIVALGKSVTVDGTLDASGDKGGFIETSGDHVDYTGATITAGQGGQWLVDPASLTVDAAAATTIMATLNSGTDVTLTTTASSTSGPGVQNLSASSSDIIIGSPLSWIGTATLTLSAYNNIAINSAIAATYGKLSLGAGGGIGASAAINVGTFLLTSGAWFQNTLSLPVFAANDFQVSGGTFSRFAGGSGTSGTPYKVADIYGLQGLATLGASLGVKYALANDIDASVTQYWNAGSGFVPIGAVYQFGGTLDGADHFVRSLTINRPNTDAVGLFAFTASGTVSNLNLAGALITGRDYVGGLVGFAGGTITGSSVTGNVAGRNDVGGLAGTVISGQVSDSFSSASVTGSGYVGGVTGLLGGGLGASIADSYASGAVSGADRVGGLVGELDAGAITRAYATGSVFGNSQVGGLVGNMNNAAASVSQAYATGRVTGTSVTGGLLGRNGSGAVSASFWDTSTTTQALSVGSGASVGTSVQSGDPAGGSYAYTATTYTAGGWSVGTVMTNALPSTAWLMVDGETRPFLTAEYTTNIVNAHQLQLAAFDLDANYTLLTDIDAGETAGTYAAGMWTTRGFVPIGRNSPAQVRTGGWSGTPFQGNFNGAGHFISGLTINRSNESYVGLFGATYGVVHDVGLVNADILAWTAVGAVAGSNAGQVYNAYSTGRVRGTTGIGGLLGVNFNSIFHDYSSATVAYVTIPFGGSGFSGFGGLVGVNISGAVISSAYATGSVTATVGNIAGGLVGENDGNVAETYATGRVTGGSANGGLVGNNVGNLNASYWDMTTTGLSGSVGTGNFSVNAIGVQSSDPAQARYAFNASTYASFGWSIATSMGNTLPGSNWLMVDGETRPFGTWEYQTSITNAHQLQLATFDLDADYKLTAEINLTDVLGNVSQMWKTSASGSTSYGFVPIALTGTAFSGSFDGSYHAITGLSITRPATAYVGLFSKTQGASLISNLTLAGASISGRSNVGSLIGDMSITGTTAGIMRVTAAGSVAGFSGSVGGIVGSVTTSATGTAIARTSFTGTANAGSANFAGGIAGSFTSSVSVYAAAADLASGGSVIAAIYGGGIFGSVYAASSMRVTDAKSTASVSGNGNLGGLIGIATGQNSGTALTIQRVSASGNVISTSNVVGGLIGQLIANSGSSVSLLDSYASGSVSDSGSSVANVGGLVGYAYANAGSVLISRSYATGAVDAPSGDFIGGLVGQAVAGSNSTAEINQSFATGTVRASDTDGGLIGFVYSNGTNSTVNVKQSYSTGAVRSASGSWVGAGIGQAYTSQSSSVVFISEVYATGDIVNVGRGLIGSTTVSAGTVTVTSSYWDKDTTGQTTSAGLPNANGVTTAVLQGALPAGFDSSVWGILPGVSYPYLKWRYPTGPSIISGAVAGVGGGNAALAVAIADAGALLGTAYTGANGYYYFASDPIGVADPTLTYLTGVRFYGGTIADRGNAVSRTDASRQATGMNIDAGWVNVRSPLTTLTSVQTNQMAAAKGALSDAAIRYAVSGGYLGLVAGTNVSLTIDNASFAIDASLANNAQFVITNTGDLVINSGASIQSTATGTAITLATGGKFTNNAGAAALVANNGRWLVWSNNPANDTRDGLDYGFKQYDAAYGVTAAADATHNGFLYTIAPTLTPQFTGTVEKQYDSDNVANPDITASGLIDGDSLAVAYSSATYDNKNVGTGKLVSVSGLSLTVSSGAAPVYGYQYATTLAGNVGKITQAPLSITPNSGLTKVYGDSDPTIGYSVGGTVFAGDSVAGALARAGGEAVGSYAVALGSVSAGSNYALTLTPTNFLITPATLHVTADHQTKVYGDSDPALTYVATAADFRNGDTNTVLTGDLTRDPGEGVGDRAIAQGSLSAGSNYVLAFTGNTLTIGQATLHVTADHQTKVYGDSDPALTYVATAADFRNGDTDTILTGDLTRDPGEGVGNRAIAQGTLSAGANYAIAFTGNMLTIGQATLHVTADHQTKVYGDGDPALTYVATAADFRNGDTDIVLTGDLARDPGEGVGDRTITSGSLSAGPNYVLAFTGNTLTITQATLHVTADHQTKVYGDSDPALTYVATAADFRNGDTSAILTGDLTRDPGEGVGDRAITSGTLAAGPNYVLAFTGNTLTITQATLHVTADHQTKVYGDSDPALTYAVTLADFKNGDTSAILTGDLTRDPGEGVGDRAITQGTLSAGANYAIAFTGNTLTIGQATLHVAADHKNKVYGDTDPTLTYAVTLADLKNGDTTAILTGGLTRAAGEDVGDRAITQGSLSAGANYVIAYTGNTLTIGQATLNVAADHKTKVYGDTDPALTYVATAADFKNGDTSTILTGALVRAAGENVGDRAITQGSLSAGANYVLAFTGNTLTITQATLNVAADHKTKVYGDADPLLTYSAVGYKNGDGVGIFTGSLTRAAGENVGDRAITQGSLAATANYILVFTGNTLTIGQRPVIATADNLSKTAGQPDPMLTYSVNPGGLLSGDTLSGSLVRDGGELAGAYAIRQGSLAAPSFNYALAFVGGTLTIVDSSSPTPPGNFIFEPADFSAISSWLAGEGDGSASEGESCSGEDSEDCPLPYPANQSVPPFITFTASL